MSQKTNIQTEEASRRRLRLAVLMADPLSSPTAEEAAKLLGVSRKTIQRDFQTIRPDLQKAGGMLEEYKTLLAERLPVSKRVSLYEELTNSTNPFAKLKALERIDELSGIISDADLIKARQNEGPAAPQAMFMLPAGTSISFSASSQRPAIDVTPERKE